ncbi:MAG: hypothetical protein MJ121_00275 [Clostridia bacterium]|nr:hypothetical protein [Clostridia bacterium]
MSDFLNSMSNDDELESILREMKGIKAEDENTEAEASRSWSLDDIDKLIAGEKVEHKPEKLAPKTSRFFSDELDSDLFSVKPITEDAPVIEDISSGSTDDLDGQEKFFEEEAQQDNFDAESFEIETVIMPDDIPQARVNKYNNAPKEPEEQAPPKIEEEKPEEKAPIDYRERFFKKLTLDDIGFVPDSDPEPTGPIDKPGTVVFKHDESKNDNFLDPLPTVKAAEDASKFDMEKTRIAGTAAPVSKPAEKQNDDVEGQIVLTGFVDIPEEAIPEKDTEGNMEESLWNRRQEKAKTFVVEGIDDEGFGEGFDEISENVDDYVAPEVKEKKEPKSHLLVDHVGEYTNVSERNTIYNKLGNRVKRKQRSAIIVAAIEGVLLLLTIVPAIINLLSGEGALGALAGNEFLLSILSAVLIIVAIAIDTEKFIDSLKGLFSGKITGDTAVAVAAAVAFLQNTISAVTGGETPTFGVIAVAGLLISRVTELIDAKRVFNNFAVCAFTYEHNMSAIHSLDNESEVFELGRGLLMGNADLIYSSKAEFPENFIKNSDSKQDSEKYTSILLIASLALSAIVAVIVGAVIKDYRAVLAAFAAGVTLSAPVFAKFIPSYITYIHNRSLNHEGTMIVSLDAAEKVASANAVVVDAADIFDRDSCTMHGMKSFETMRIDVVLLYAAAMVIKSGGPLKESFEQVVDGRQDLLPPVRELVYEDKMGISARIYEQKVLLGNRSMLTHHNIEAPDPKLEEKYSHDGRKVIYLAVNEKLAALFVVSYSADEETRIYFKQLEKSGIQTLIRTNDVNVTEDLIAERFEINASNFKILSSVAGRLYKRRKDAISETVEAGVIHDGKPQSMLKAIAASCKMSTRSKIGTALQFVLVVAMVALTAVFGITGAVTGIATWIAILLMIGEIAVVVAALTPFDYIFNKKQ